MRQLLVPGLALACLGGLAAAGSPPPRATASVTGTITVMDKGDRPAEDVGQAVIWLETEGPVEIETRGSDMVTESKQFLPHVLVIAAGSNVSFPNHDPFNHNVFSLSEAGRFDLGLYGRGEGKSHRFDDTGIVRVYCNVHATMGGFILVRDNPYYTQPSADGSFTIAGVPPGNYTLRAWHERTKSLSRSVYVTESGLTKLVLELDARGYSFKPHLNKFGQPYTRQGSRY